MKGFVGNCQHKSFLQRPLLRPYGSALSVRRQDIRQGSRSSRSAHGRAWSALMRYETVRSHPMSGTMQLATSWSHS
jgi:hypothetical protein